MSGDAGSKQEEEERIQNRTADDAAGSIWREEGETYRREYYFFDPQANSKGICDLKRCEGKECLYKF